MSYLPAGLWLPSTPVVALNAGKCAHRPRQTKTGPEGSGAPAATQWMNWIPRSTLRSHPFTSKRFHVLLNSLFKVLFNFPSRYLFAIGLVPVFSLRWSLPPTLGCILKQPDSKEHQSDAVLAVGPDTRYGSSPDQEDSDGTQAPRGSPKHHSSRRPKTAGIRCWALPASLAVTKGILVSFFSSAYWYA